MGRPRKNKYEKVKKRAARIGDAYHPISAARDLGYPDFIINAMFKAKSMEEMTKIMIDARNGYYAPYIKN